MQAVLWRRQQAVAAASHIPPVRRFRVATADNPPEDSTSDTRGFRDRAIHQLVFFRTEPRSEPDGSSQVRLHLESLGFDAGTINRGLAAVRRLAYEAADTHLLCPELAAGIRRVKGVKHLWAPDGPDGKLADARSSQLTSCNRVHRR